MTTNKHKIQAYLDDNLYQYLESYAEGKKLSVSQSVSEILTTFFDNQSNPQTIDRQTLQKAIALLSSLVESESPVTHQESESPVTHPESESPVTHPDTILQHLYGVVLVEDKKIKAFWDGRKYQDDPNRLKIYRNIPQSRVISKAEIEASFRGQARWNDLFKILEIMGYPHGFDKWKTINLERKWVDANLDS